MSSSKITVIALLVVVAGLLGWVIYEQNSDEQTTNNSSEVDQNEDAVDDDDTEDQPTDNDQTGDDQPQQQTFTSLDGVEIRLDDFSSGQAISSPLTLTGEVPGNWSFEASFGVVLTNWDGLIIAEEPAVLTGDWMTTDYVPFEVTLTFNKPEVYENGSLILQKANPSGEAANDDAVEIPIIFD